MKRKPRPTRPILYREPYLIDANTDRRELEALSFNDLLMLVNRAADGDKEAKKRLEAIVQWFVPDDCVRLFNQGRMIHGDIPENESVSRHDLRVAFLYGALLNQAKTFFKD